MNNYISIRIETKKQHQINHNLRITKINYIKNEDIKNIHIDKNLNIIKFSHNDSTQKNEYYTKIKNDLNDFKNLIIETNNNYIKDYNENRAENEKRKRSSIRKNTNYFNSGIITFSTQMQQDFEKNPNDFIERLKQFHKDFEEKYNTKITNSSIHLDETTPHIHFDFLNYNFKTNQTLKRHLSKNDLSNFQDLAAKHFQDFENGNYMRGEKIEKTNAKHLNIKQAHKAELFKNDITKKLDYNNSNLEQLLKIRNQKRIETKKLDSREDINNNKIILKELTKKINNERKIIKELKKIITKTIDKNTGFFKPNINEIVKDIHSVLKTNDSIKLLNDISQITTSLKTDNNNLIEKEEEIKELNKIIKGKNKELNYKNNEIDSITKSKNIEIDSLKKQIEKSQKNDKNIEDLNAQVKSLLKDNSRQRERISQLTKSKTKSKSNNIDL